MAGNGSTNVVVLSNYRPFNRRHLPVVMELPRAAALPPALWLWGWPLLMAGIGYAALGSLCLDAAERMFQPPR